MHDFDFIVPLSDICEKKLSEEEMETYYDIIDELELTIEDQEYRLDSCHSLLDDILELTKEYVNERDRDPFFTKLYTLVLKYAASKDYLY